MIDFLFWGMITVLVLSPALNIMLIGQPREPITSGAALTNLIFTVVVIMIILAKVMQSHG